MDASGSLTQYVWGLTYVNDLVLRDRNADGLTGGGQGKAGSGMAERVYALRDANHDVTTPAGQTGTVLERFDDELYGNVTGLNPDFSTYTGSDYEWIYLFQGGRKDAVSGLYVFGARGYSAALGR